MKGLKEIVKENKEADVDKMVTYEFADDSVNCHLIVRINVDKEKVKRLLKKYRELDEDYNTTDWIDFLEHMGYRVEIVKIDHSIFF